MGADTARTSPAKRRIQMRQRHILAIARDLLLQHGYHGLTMDRIAAATQFPKGTIYLQFGCKEDLILALAAEYLEQRLTMIRRAAAYPGLTRERAIAVGEAVALFARLRPDDSRIIHIAGGAIREKGEAWRVEAVKRLEYETVALLHGIIEEALQTGELVFQGDANVPEMAFALCSLIEGGYILAEEGFHQHTLGIEAPVQEMWWIFNRMADAYGWRPKFMERDWEASMADIRRTLFPVETQQLYGEGCWYGDMGKEHPGRRRSF